MFAAPPGILTANVMLNKKPNNCHTATITEYYVKLIKLVISKVKL